MKPYLFIALIILTIIASSRDGSGVIFTHDSATGQNEVVFS